ncbi:hypothetical protein Scep_030090 [Stephania cephalantha]|uniref:Uncharacterized protein n=1 Tax=Stephania cephalantha TaxID=152367 RepID=A0AAP0E6M7_9MAGN
MPDDEDITQMTGRSRMTKQLECRCWESEFSGKLWEPSYRSSGRIGDSTNPTPSTQVYSAVQQPKPPDPSPHMETDVVEVSTNPALQEGHLAQTILEANPMETNSSEMLPQTPQSVGPPATH